MKGLFGFTKKVLTLGLAKRLVAGAEPKRRDKGASAVIAVVGDGGQLILLERLDDTQSQVSRLPSLNPAQRQSSVVPPKSSRIR
jgi:hypothetical protein